MEWEPDRRWSTNIPFKEGGKVRSRERRINESYELSNLKIVSVPDSGGCGFAVATFDIGGNMILSSWARKYLAEGLTKRFNSDVWKDRWFRAVTGEHGSGFKVLFRLRGSFTEDSLEFAKDLAYFLDVGDYSWGSFSIWRETMHPHGEGFIPFTYHFKIQHGVRIYDEIPVELMPSLTEMTP